MKVTFQTYIFFLPSKSLAFGQVFRLCINVKETRSFLKVWCWIYSPQETLTLQICLPEIRFLLGIGSRTINSETEAFRIITVVRKQII